MDYTTEKSSARMEWAGFKMLAPEINSALLAMSAAVKNSGLEEELVELVKLRASQINGCAFCVQWHSAEARKLGASDDKISLLCVWRDAEIFTAREGAAFAWCEALTLITDSHVPEELYQKTCEVFSDKELAALTGAIVMINGWNRIGVAYRFTPLVK